MEKLVKVTALLLRYLISKTDHQNQLAHNNLFLPYII